jgi:hypothetical protein
MDLADRSQGDGWRQVADLLADAAAPSPKFAVAVCEEIERVARDTLASLTVEKELSRRGIPIFAADEPPASKEPAPPPSWSAGSARASRTTSGSRCSAAAGTASSSTP